MKRKLAAFALAMLWAAVASAEEGLVAHYAFEEGSGAILKDHSGNRLDGKISGKFKWAKGPYGTALEFNGKDTHVDCGKGWRFNISATGTVMVWCKPRILEGGLVNWSVGGHWPDCRLILLIDNYHPGSGTAFAMSDGHSHSHIYFGPLERQKWNHLTLTFDGKMARIYRNGFLDCQTSQNAAPNIEDVTLWLGRCCAGWTRPYFNGLLDEVRIYNRPLTALEVLACYKKEAPARGKDVTVFHKVVLEAEACPDPGRIIANLDARGMQPLPRGTRLRAALFGQGARKPEMQIEVSDIPMWRAAERALDARRLRAGTYVIRAEAIGPDGARIGEVSSVTVEWPGQPAAFKTIRILNNLCWELLDVQGDARIGRRREFLLPLDRWVFIRTKASVTGDGEVRVALDPDVQDLPIALHTRTGSLEAMRYLKAGEQTLHVGRKGNAGLDHLEVRAIPALQHAFYGSNPHIRPYGPYEWEFLEKDILPNVNVMISGAIPKPQQLKAWKDAGRSWISIRYVGKWKKGTTADEVLKFWTDSAGMQQPLMDGIIIDEFGGGDQPIYDVYRQTVENIHANPKFKGKAIHPYAGTFYRPDRSRRFAQVCMRGGGYVCLERYLPEQPTREDAEELIRRRIGRLMPEWERGLPGVTRRMIMVLSHASQPTWHMNNDPTVDFKVYMDMQMRALATRRVFFGLGGIQEYHSSYSDEEHVRWAGRLYRHYAIEGNTEPLTRDPYKVTHIRNPDFADGIKGWTIRPAEAGSVRPESHNGYAGLQGRTPPAPMGDTFLLMKRSAKRPNTFSQQIKNLTPGRLYSMKMITADYQDLVQEKSVKKQNAVSIRLDNVQILPGPKKSFQFTFPNNYSRHLGKFNAKHNYWMNYHWRVFRANGTTAELTVSDWQSDKEPGGPIGQELMFNFIEIQPYLE